MRLRLTLTFLLALLLSIIPMPEFLTGLKPAWVLLVVLYIQFFLPRWFNLPELFMIALCLDVLLATMLGEHPFALFLTTWLASRNARHFHFYPMGQQMALILSFSFLYQLTLTLTDAFAGEHYSLIMASGSALFSMLAWPWLCLLGDSTLLWAEQTLRPQDKGASTLS